MTTRSKRTSALALIGWLVLSYAVSAVGAAASFQAQSFYGELAQPSWAPPAWLFGPVWTALFTAMGVAAWLVWREGGLRARRSSLGLFALQLVLNGLWSWLFFAWRLGGAAFVDIVLLWLLILLTTLAFWRARPLAGALLVPYLLWVSFAAALNYALWQLNPNVLG